MLILTVAVCAGMMTVCALIKGFTARRLSELKRELSALSIDEGRAREERGRIEIRIESAEARSNNLTFEIEKGNKELEDLAELVGELETKMSKAEAEEEEFSALHATAYIIRRCLGPF